MEGSGQSLPFWSWALANMALAVVLAWLGFRRIRERRVREHRRFMLAAASLVVLFLVAYLVKVALIGRENLALWSQADRMTLWFHETCVAGFLLGGVTAATIARRNRFRLIDGATPEALANAARWHRRAGWTALVSASLALVSAALVLSGMFSRAG